MHSSVQSQMILSVQTISPIQRQMVSVSKRGTDATIYTSRLTRLIDLSVHLTPTSKKVILPHVGRSHNISPVSAYVIDYVYELKELEILSLYRVEGDHNIFDISLKIQNLPALKTLNYNNQCKKHLLTQIDCSFSIFLLKLTCLNLSNNHVERDDLIQITHLSALKSLILNHCYIEYVPREFRNLEHLSHLDLSFNCFWWEYLNNALEHSTSLTSLNLENTHLDEIPPIIGQMHKLTYLNLARNNFTTDSIDGANSVFAKLTNLTTLNLRLSELRSFPTQICFLPKLEHLDLQTCYFQCDLPDELFGMKSLTTLKLHKVNPRISDLVSRMENLKLLVFFENFVEVER